MTMDTKLKL